MNTKISDVFVDHHISTLFISCIMYWLIRLQLSYPVLYWIWINT